MAERTIEDYKDHLEYRCFEFKTLAMEVMDDPSYWTLLRFTRRYGMLPKRRRSDNKKIDRFPSRAKAEWEGMKRHGIELTD